MVILYDKSLQRNASRIDAIHLHWPEGLWRYAKTAQQRIKSLTLQEVEHIAFTLAQKHLSFNEPIPEFSFDQELKKSREMIFGSS